MLDQADEDSAVLTLQQLADLTGLRVSTLRAYLSRAAAGIPPTTSYDSSGRRVWLDDAAAAARTWAANRSGKGFHGDSSRHAENARKGHQRRLASPAD